MANLNTERLILRPFIREDREAAYAVLEGHPDVWRYDPGYRRTIEQRNQELEYRILEYARNGFGCLAVTLRESGTLIGYCGLQMYLLPGDLFSTPEVELFYKFGRDFWGQGYALEACREVLRFAFQELRVDRIVTWTQAQNERSLRLLRKLGMTLEPAPGKPQDIIGILDNPRPLPPLLR